MKTFKLHLIRHGLTQGNIDGVYVGGGLDMPLCDAGVEALRQMARRCDYPKVPVVFSSPMARALQTADILYPEVRERLILEDLRENVFGIFEGLPVRELAKDKRFKHWLNPTSGYTPEGGESGKAFSERVVHALGQMFRHLVDNGLSQAACITHGGVIMSMMSQMAVPRKPYTEWMADNGCGFTVQASTSMLMRDNLVELAGYVPSQYRTGS
ncbi:MAG: histidine phosphatase family protein [Oscillospiraceae bacterium]